MTSSPASLDWGFPLGEIRIPVALWYGTLDPVVSPSTAAYAQRLPHASEVYTRAADHLLAIPCGGTFWARWGCPRDGRRHHRHRRPTNPTAQVPPAWRGPGTSSKPCGEGSIVDDRGPGGGRGVERVDADAGGPGDRRAGRDLDASPGVATWVLTAFLLASAILAPLFSSLGDRYGKRRLLLVVLWVYLVGTLGAMAAWNLGALVGFRAVQGISLAVLPSGSILREAVAADRVALGLGVTSGVLGAGAGIGLVAGGLIVDHGSWRWLFALGAATAVGALGLVARHVPESTVRSVRRLDLAGSGVLALALTALLA